MISSNSNWNEFIKEVQATQKALNVKNHEECFFRGHTCANYILTPSLFRDGTTNGNRISKNRWYAECDMFYEFKTRAKELHKENLNDWDILFYMQHHLLPTRLLDWTEHFGVALYFALLPLIEKKFKKNNLSKDFIPCIWMLNPYLLNKTNGFNRQIWNPENIVINSNLNHKHSYAEVVTYGYGTEDEDIFDNSLPIAIYPMRKGNRITNQGGYFTFHRDDCRPLDKFDKNENYLKKLLIPIDEASLEDALNFLQLSGINYYTLFPDLDGLAKYLRIKYIV